MKGTFEMTNYTAYPLEFGNITPGPNFTRIQPKKRPDGVSDGFHTGSAWLSPDGQFVYKPLDARPYPNATERFSTDEDKALGAMRGVEGFPDNWHVEERNGRRWLVRPFCYLWPQDSNMLIKPHLDVFLMVERAIREMNHRQWTYNDLPQLAYDPNIHEWFLLDLSNAHHQDSWHEGDGDWYRFAKWYKLMGLDHISQLRERGRHVQHAIMLPEFNDPKLEPYDVQNSFYMMSKEQRRQHFHLYVSTLRPLSMWCNIDGTVFLRGDLSKSPRVHTWVASNHPLDQDTLDRYELTWAWSPWP